MESPDLSSDFYLVLKTMILSGELVSPSLEQVLIALVRRGYLTVEESQALLDLAGDSSKS